MLKIKEFDGKNLILTNNKKGGKQMTMLILPSSEEVILNIVNRDGTIKNYKGCLDTKEFFTFFDASLQNLWDLLKETGDLFINSWLHEYMLTGNNTVHSLRDILASQQIIKFIKYDAFDCIPFSTCNKYGMSIRPVESLSESFGNSLSNLYKILHAEKFILEKRDFIKVYSSMLGGNQHTTDKELELFCDRIIYFNRMMNPVKNLLSHAGLPDRIFRYLIPFFRNSPKSGSNSTENLINYITSEHFASLEYIKSLNDFINYIQKMDNDKTLSLKLDLLPEDLEKSKDFINIIESFYKFPLDMNMQFLIEGFRSICRTFTDFELNPTRKDKYDAEFSYNGSSFVYDSYSIYTLNPKNRDRSFNLYLPCTSKSFIINYNKYFTKETLLEYLKTIFRDRILVIGLMDSQDVYLGNFKLTFNENYDSISSISYDCFDEGNKSIFNDFVNIFRKV